VALLNAFGSCGDGTKQAVWQDAACALHNIMQFVAVEVCASRIFPVAPAKVAHTATVIESRKAIEPRMSRLHCGKIIARHPGVEN